MDALAERLDPDQASIEQKIGKTVKTKKALAGTQEPGNDANSNYLPAAWVIKRMGHERQGIERDCLSYPTSQFIQTK